MAQNHQHTSKENDILKEVIQLAYICKYDEKHSRQVADLALVLFDQLQDIHKLDRQARFWLECAAILHDIGGAESWKGHHKNTLHIILSTKLLSLDNRTRLIIGSIARYHRKALPNLKHDHFAALDSKAQKIVINLAAILRLTNGLTRIHPSRMLDISCKISPKNIIIKCIIPGPLPDKNQHNDHKGFLLEDVYNRKLIVLWKSG